jgi:hypothetical protein
LSCIHFALSGTLDLDSPVTLRGNGASVNPLTHHPKGKILQQYLIFGFNTMLLVLLDSGDSATAKILSEVHNKLHTLVKRVEGTEKELKEIKRHTV